MPSPLAPPFVLGVLAALLYARGRARHMRVVSERHRAGMGWRALAFWTALVTLVLALDSVIDDKADRYFWVHMVQHVLLMMVVAPLLVLSAPWLPMWKGLPLSTRRGLGGAYMRSPGWRAARAVGRAVAAPVAVWILFSIDIVAWHVPALYGLTLRSQTVHDLEHLSFLVLAVLFWAQVIESPPLRLRLDQARRVVYVTAGATVCWVLAIVLTFASSPLYAGYQAAASHRHGLSALADQQLAAGIMVGPGSIPYAVFVFVALYRWLGGGGVGRRPEPAPSVARSTPLLDSALANGVADPPVRAGAGGLARRS